jgi:fructosamine-3-kinase
LGAIDRSGPLGRSLWQVVVAGRELVVKVGTGVVDEAEGLRSLSAVAGAPPVPEVVLAESELLVTGWVAQGTRTAGHDEAFGHGLARLHQGPRLEWGGGSSWIGACPVSPATQPDGTAFYRHRLVELGHRCGMERLVSPVVGRLDRLLPPGGPSLVHGDLWWGNVLWGADGRAWLIDPSVHGGHPEEDLAMLGLFGTVPERVLQAYLEVHPLDPDWPDRVDLFRLVPLLVHTVLFGGGYRTQAEGILRRLA